jgi:hypothetical protein
MVRVSIGASPTRTTEASGEPLPLAWSVWGAPTLTFGPFEFGSAIATGPGGEEYLILFDGLAWEIVEREIVPMLR